MVGQPLPPQKIPLPSPTPLLPRLPRPAITLVDSQESLAAASAALTAPALALAVFSPPLRALTDGVLIAGSLVRPPGLFALASAVAADAPVFLFHIPALDATALAAVVAPILADSATKIVGAGVESGVRALGAVLQLGAVRGVIDVAGNAQGLNEMLAEKAGFSFDEALESAEFDQRQPLGKDLQVFAASRARAVAMVYDAAAEYGESAFDVRVLDVWSCVECGERGLRERRPLGCKCEGWGEGSLADWLAKERVAVGGVTEKVMAREMKDACVRAETEIQARDEAEKVLAAQRKEEKEVKKVNGAEVEEAESVVVKSEPLLETTEPLVAKSDPLVAKSEALVAKSDVPVAKSPPTSAAKPAPLSSSLAPAARADSSAQSPVDLFPAPPARILCRLPPAPSPSHHATNSAQSATPSTSRLPALDAPDSVIVVSSVRDIASACLSLAKCNVLSISFHSPPLGRKLGDAVLVDGSLILPPILIAITGVAVADPRPKPRTAHPATPTEFGRVVYLFHLKSIHHYEIGHTLSAGLGPIFADPEKIIVGVGIEDGLRAFAGRYAANVSCLKSTVCGVRDLGVLRGEEGLGSGIERALAVYAGVFTKEETLSSIELNMSPLREAVKVYAANRARIALMVYFCAGSSAFAGDEMCVEPFCVKAWVCKKCGEAGIAFRVPLHCACDGWQALGREAESEKNMRRWLRKGEASLDDREIVAMTHAARYVAWSAVVTARKADADSETARSLDALKKRKLEVGKKSDEMRPKKKAKKVKKAKGAAEVGSASDLRCGRTAAPSTFIPMVSRTQGSKRFPSTRFPSLLPPMAVVLVSKVRQIGAAVCELAACNVLSMCLISSSRSECDVGEAVFVDGMLVNSPMYLGLTGVFAEDPRPAPRDVHCGFKAEIGGKVFLFDISGLLPHCAKRLGDALGPLLADPKKIIVGASIEKALRALSYSPAAANGWLTGVVRNVRDISVLRGEEYLGRNDKRLQALYGGALVPPSRTLSRKAWNLRPLPNDLQVHAANEARWPLIVYFGAGARQFSGEEKCVDLSAVEVWVCRKCGEAGLNFRAPLFCVCGGWQALGREAGSEGNLKRWMKQGEISAGRSELVDLSCEAREERLVAVKISRAENVRREGVQIGAERERVLKKAA